MQLSRSYAGDPNAQNGPEGQDFPGSQEVVPSSVKNQADELPPGAGLISCACSRSAGLGWRRSLPPEDRHVSLLVP